MYKSIIPTITILLSANVYGTETLSVSSIEWCPQLCSNGDKAGYVFDTVQEVFKDSPYVLKNKVYPWTRAIRNVESGESHALLSPAKQEAPGLKFPTQEVGLQRMCFFKKSSSSWVYNGLASLENVRVGIATDTSIEELNGYIRDNPHKFDSMPYSDSYIKTSLKKLDKDRIDAFVFTYNSTIYELQQLGLSDDYKAGGCVSSAKIYMAFTPEESDSSKINEMISYFDKKMVELKESGKVAEIMAAYGLEDWQSHL
tara:strand:- start:1563 stop:2330 length:768 start_codon:yes stop_codon:yes gene_type:complete